MLLLSSVCSAKPDTARQRMRGLRLLYVCAAVAAIVAVQGGCGPGGSTTSAYTGITPGDYKMIVTPAQATSVPEHVLSVKPPAENTRDNPYEFEIKTAKTDQATALGAIALRTDACGQSTVKRSSLTYTITIATGTAACATFVTAVPPIQAQSVTVESGTVTITFSSDGRTITGSVDLTSASTGTSGSQRYEATVTGNRL